MAVARSSSRLRFFSCAVRAMRPVEAVLCGVDPPSSYPIRSERAAEKPSRRAVAARSPSTLRSACRSPPSWTRASRRRDLTSRRPTGSSFRARHRGTTVVAFATRWPSGSSIALCGASCHPGPGVTFLPGYGAVRGRRGARYPHPLVGAKRCIGPFLHRWSQLAVPFRAREDAARR